MNGNNDIFNINTRSGFNVVLRTDSNGAYFLDVTKDKYARSYTGDYIKQITDIISGAFDINNKDNMQKTNIEYQDEINSAVKNLWNSHARFEDNTIALLWREAAECVTVGLEPLIETDIVVSPSDIRNARQEIINSMLKISNGAER